VDRNEAIAKARQFAQTAYSDEMERISREFQEKLVAKRSEAVAKGNSGALAAATGRLHGERIQALLQARLNTLLEGYELYQVELDDQIAAHILTDVMALHEIMLGHAASVQQIDRGAVSPHHYVQLVRQNVGMSHNSVKVQIDRRRLMPKKDAPGQSATNIYHVHGHNPRWNVNSQDRSVNVVTVSNDQVFADLREAISSSVPPGDEQNDVLARLSALEQAQNTPSFAQRYTDFIATAANHMQVIGPFIPALTEMLRKALS
jgi:hypothetical protein